MTRLVRICIRVTPKGGKGSPKPVMALLVRATRCGTVLKWVARTSRAMTVKREYPSPVLRYPHANADKPGHVGKKGERPSPDQPYPDANAA